MIELIFEFGSEVILVVIEGHDVKFGNTSFGAQLADISGLRLDYNGVCREFPDLETSKNWREETINRFKEKVKQYNTEDEISDYILSEFVKMGYKPKSKQKKGFRRENIK